MPHANALVIAGKIPGAWLVQIKDAGHAVMDQYPDEISKILQTFLSITQFIIIQLNVNQNVIDLVMIVIVCYTDLYYIYFNYCDRYFSLKDKNITRLDFHLIQNSTGSVGLVPISVLKVGSQNSREQSEL